MNFDFDLIYALSKIRKVPRLFHLYNCQFYSSQDHNILNGHENVMHLSISPSRLVGPGGGDTMGIRQQNTPTTGN